MNMTEQTRVLAAYTMLAFTVVVTLTAVAELVDRLV